MRKKNKKLIRRKIVLRLPDLDHTKSAVLNSLSSPHSRRNYKFAMEQFITWYCSEPRLALNRAVVLRFRLHLESLGLAAGTINQRLAAVRRLAYEAADSGLLSPELAAGIRRVKGVKQLGSRSGNWLNSDQARLLLEKSDGESLRSVRDVAMISILLGCGLRRAELAGLRKKTFKFGRGTGPLLISWAKATTSARFLCRFGLRVRLTGGWRQRRWRTAECSERSADTELHGVEESLRMSYGMSFEALCPTD